MVMSRLSALLAIKSGDSSKTNTVLVKGGRTMPSREELTAVFQDTRQLYETDPVLMEAIRASIAGTALYPEGETPPLPTRRPWKETCVAVSGARSLEAALRLLEEDPDRRVAVHNFASATNPGGGVTRGSGAQEECLCRCSTLYPVLTGAPGLWENFYAMHRARRDARYTDACIYSPDIVVVKSDEALPQRLPPEQRRRVDVLTCAAPNLRPVPYHPMNPGSGHSGLRLTAEELRNLHKKRARHMLSVAARHGAAALVLGAFGCGAFQNDPSVVARAWRDMVEEFDGWFEEIVFAVYCPPGGSRNYDEFRRVMR